MLEVGKLFLLGKELDKMNVSVCRLTEVRWEGQGHFNTTEGHKIVYYGLIWRTKTRTTRSRHME